MNPYDVIKAQMGGMVPFAGHVGVVIEAVGDGTATATLSLPDHAKNHLGTMHAGALFTLGEAASGAAMAGAFAARLMEARPVATSAQIDYRRPAKSAVHAAARVDGDVQALRAALDKDRKVAFPVAVSLTAEDGTEVATMRVDWQVRLG